jgi:hypothetical protein
VKGRVSALVSSESSVQAISRCSSFYAAAKAVIACCAAPPVSPAFTRWFNPSTEASSSGQTAVTPAAAKAESNAPVIRTAGDASIATRPGCKAATIAARMSRNGNGVAEMV